ncbi:acetylxylan esterase [Wocania ichthyoenteri]|uniref:acetylxylan esterase n=1 Tax=Wocania ichthyoenteri TaxID=1230531 RepID=UPI00053DA224|nr:acetylxylan esterase [Wocania ichthyoenteri]
MDRTGKKKTRKFLLIYLVTLFCVCISYAQPRKELVNIVITPNHADWKYNIGDKAIFNIKAYKNDVLLDTEIKYTVKPERTAIIDEGVLKSKRGSAVVKAESLKKPGFLRCFAKVEVDGHTFSNYSTVGYAVDKIEPTTTLPSDFTQFWEEWKQKLKDIPIEPIFKLLPDQCTDKVDVYEVSIKNIYGKIYGILCKPKKKGKFPAILHVPGAGVRPHSGDIASAAKGYITLRIGIHGISVTLEPQVYSDLSYGALRNYYFTNLDNKDNYYYKRVYLGCIRAVDLIYSLDEFDGNNIAVTGGSQGGALSIITAGLDSRISYLAASFPALSDLTGYLENRAGGWPGMFQTKESQLDDHIETSKYYDVVNFARFVKVPGWYTWGFNDYTCPPTSTYSAYNIINAEKELHLFQDTGHWSYPEQDELRFQWLYNKLGN